MKVFNRKAAEKVRIPDASKIVIEAVEFESADEYETAAYFHDLSEPFDVSGALIAYRYAD